MARQYEFEVVETYDHASFVKEIKEYLTAGWELHGQLIAFPNHIENGTVQSVRYIQAIKKDITPVAPRRTGSYST
jgi:hypothetical protein